MNKARHKPDSMTADQGRVEAERAAQTASAQQRLAALRTRMDQASRGQTGRKSRRANGD